jgi:single-stranded-DNA-specific exonuclease
MTAPVKLKLLSPDRYTVNEIAYELEIPVPAAAVYVNRGLNTIDKINDFCDLGYHRLHDPNLLPDMEVAVDRLIKAINSNEHIHVHGDYDVDGITACATIIYTLRKLKANITYQVPHRINDGYDIQVATIEKAKLDDVNLLISVDCGILGFNAADRAKELGVDLIITDHHIPSDDGRIPDCIAVINANRHDSKYPFKDLSGVGIAMKFMVALWGKLFPNQDLNLFMSEIIEYAALGTVADVAPMLGENRSIVHLGSLQLQNSKKLGVVQLLKVAGVSSVNTTAIGFFVAPRINAMGRLADPTIALDLLLETSPGRATYIANQLDAMNKRRQDKQDQILAEAKDLIEEDLSDTSVLVIGAKGWHPGLIGLVAGRVAEEYGRPTLVCTINTDGIAKGSCRSTRSFDILDALKSPNCIGYFSKLGGHKFAAGFELREIDIESLKININSYAKDITGGGIKGFKVIDVDCKIDSSSIDLTICNAVSKLAPFGSGNLEPLFLTKGVLITNSDTVGSGKHLKLRVRAGKYDNQWLPAMWWRHGDVADVFCANAVVDIIYKLSMEEYMGHTNMTLIIEEMKISNA